MYRVHTCFKCQIDYVAAVKPSASSQNISGEKTEYCPVCGKRVNMSSAVFDSIEAATGSLQYPERDWSNNGKLF